MTRGAGRGAKRLRAGTAALIAAAALLAAAGSADPPAHGQEDGAGIRAPLPAASVPSVTVTIFEDGGVSVEHEVSGGSEARAVRLLGNAGGDGGAAEDAGGVGRAVGIEVVSAGDEGAAVEGYEASEDGLHVVVPPSGGDLLVRYGLEGAMRLAEPSTYSWSFLYRATTSFVLPDVVDVAFVNGQAVRFEGARAFTCHGCQMELEFTAGEQRGVQRFELGGGAAAGGQDGPRRFDVGVWTSAQVGPMAFDPASMSIAYEVGGVSEVGGRWVTLVVPPELLGPPYRAEAGGESVPLTTFDAGDGRTGVSVRPAEDGAVRIFGSTAAAAASADTPAAAPSGGGAEVEEPGAPAETRDPGAGALGEWGAAIAAAIAAAGLGAAAYIVLARRRRA